MAKNTDTKSSKRVGILLMDRLAVLEVDPKSGEEKLHPLKELFDEYDGLEITVSVSHQKEAKGNKVSESCLTKI